MHCWAGLTSQWLFSTAVGAGYFEKSWSDNDFSLCIVPTPPIWRPTAPHHSSPLPHCFAINTHFLCSPEHVWSLNSIRLYKISICSFKVNHSSNLWHPLQYMVMWYIWSCSLKYSKIKLRFWEICSAELVIISKSLIVCRWMLDFIDLLHFYRSQPLMGRRHLRVNQQGRLVVESFCRRCRFECHGAQWCGLAGSSRISRLQAWCCAFRRSSVAGGGICAW